MKLVLSRSISMHWLGIVRAQYRSGSIQDLVLWVSTCRKNDETMMEKHTILSSHSLSTSSEDVLDLFSPICYL